MGCYLWPYDQGLAQDYDILDIVHLFSLCEYKVLRLPLVIVIELLKATTTTLNVVAEPLRIQTLYKCYFFIFHPLRSVVLATSSTQKVGIFFSKVDIVPKCTIFILV